MSYGSRTSAGSYTSRWKVVSLMRAMEAAAAMVCVVRVRARMKMKTVLWTLKSRGAEPINRKAAQRRKVPYRPKSALTALRTKSKGQALSRCHTDSHHTRPCRGQHHPRQPAGDSPEEPLLITGRPAPPPRASRLVILKIILSPENGLLGVVMERGRRRRWRWRHPRRLSGGVELLRRRRCRLHEMTRSVVVPPMTTPPPQHWLPSSSTPAHGSSAW